MSDTLTAPAPAAPLLAPEQMEKMFGGLDKMADALPADKRDHMQELLAGSVDPNSDKANFANVAFLADAYGKPADEVAQNADAYRTNYAHQMGWDDAGDDDQKFYARVGQHFEQRKAERELLGEGMGKMFEAFRQGGDNWKQTFTASLAEMKGKPGYDPARLDLYRHLAEQQWQSWEGTGQHYPAVVDAIGKYLSLSKQTRHGSEDDQIQARQDALHALHSVPEAEQDAVIGLATRQAAGTKQDEAAGGLEKGAARLEGGIGTFGAEAVTSFRDLVHANPAFGGSIPGVLTDQVERKAGRRLDAAVLGQGTYKGSNWLSEATLAAGEGLPRMLAMFHPVGVLANVGAYSEEARGHFEDAGVDPAKSAALGLAASIPLTALMAVSSKTLVGGQAAGAMEGWMLRNVAGKAGAELVKGYAKNVLALGAENTAVLATVTAATQLTEPAVQAVGHLLDGTIPGVKWTGKDGELTRMANASPETLAGLVPLIVLGTGMGMLRNQANLRATVQNRPALEAIGLKPEAVRQVMEAETPADALTVLQHNFDDRQANPAAVEALNEKMIGYHGTKSQFSKFSLRRAGASDPGLVGKAAYFTPSEAQAWDFATNSRYGKGELPRVLAAEIGLKNPVIIQDGKLPDGRSLTEIHPRGITKDSATAIKKELQAQGYDGAIFKLGDEVTQIAAYDVKSLKILGESTSPQNKISLAEDGSYLVKDSSGQVIDQAASPEMAAKAAMGEQGTLDLKPAEKGAAPVEGQPIGIAAGGQIGAVIHEQVAAAKQVFREISALPAFKGFHEVLNRWVGDTQIGIMHTAADVRQVIGALPDLMTRKAVGRWLDAGGDRAQLEAWRKGSESKAGKDEYAAALKLTPEQVKVAESLQEWFKQRFERAVAAGVMDEAAFRQNYLTQLIERPFVQGGANSKFGGQLNKNFKFSQERVFPNLFELEKAGFNAKTTDVAEIMARYDSALNKAILTRQLVKDLLATKNDAGEPLAVPLKGTLRQGEGTDPNFITNPRQTVVDQAQQKIDKLQAKASELVDQIAATESFVEKADLAAERRDLMAEIRELREEMNPEDAKLYKSIDHPALRKWWWMGKDPASAKDTFMEGDIGLHPDIKTHMENALGTSGLRQWYDSEGNALDSIPKRVVKALDVSNAFLKRNLLGGLSLFHAVHEFKRALGNRVAVKPWALPEIDPTNERVKLQVRTGLMLATPHDVTNLYSHQAGLGEAGSLVDHVPVIGKISKGVSEYTFSKLIPALKSEVWNHVYERNLETFRDAIASGEASPDQVAYLTSHQINARFGHQNLADIGRNPTLQHLLQITTLAPDFWESNLRNYGQDLKGVVGAKTGREPALALAATAAALWMTSRVLNKALDDDWHFDEPFAVIADGRTYTMRNEAEDLVRMWKSMRQYVMGRLSPSSQAAEEFLSARNWRGEKISTVDVFKNWVAKVFPMSLRFLPGIKDATDALESGGGRTVSVWQQFLGSLGIQVARHSALNQAYQLANDWKKKQGDAEDTGTYPTSKFQQLRYALEDGDEERAKAELAKLTTEKTNAGKVHHGFHSSLFHPWTGSRPRDEEFKASLPADDLEMVTQAEAHRQRIWDKFIQLTQSH